MNSYVAILEKHAPTFLLDHNKLWHKITQNFDLSKNQKPFN
jgi:hypothetical protein